MKVKDFKGFMKQKALNEQADPEGYSAGMYGANPEEEGAEMEDEGAEMEGEEDMEEEEPLTLEDLKAMYDELEERVSALEPEEEGEGEEGMEEGEGEEEAPEEGEEEA